MTAAIAAPSERVSSRLDRPVQARTLWSIAAIVVVLLATKWFVVEPTRVRSDSMSPTIRPGAVLLVDKLSLRFRDPHRGELVVADDPNGNGWIVKRVVAVPGDVVGLDDGRLTVNGTLVTEPYADNTAMEGTYFGPDTVPGGHVFVLGDNRANSTDSRAFGPLAIDDIDGRVIGTVISGS